MSDLVKVKVLRVHTNDRGTHVEGDEYETTKQHAKLLEDRNIVETIGEVKAAPAPENKSAAPPQNQAAARPANKARTRPANKAAPAPENKSAATTNPTP